MLLNFILTLCLSPLSFASYEQYEAIKEIQTVEVVVDSQGNEREKIVSSKKVPSELERMFAQAKPYNNKGVGSIIMTTKNLIALGEQIYNIVKRGEPVVNYDSEPISVLPRVEGVSVNSLELENWKAPIVKRFKIYVKNYLGFTPIEFEYILTYSYDGRYQGKGKYLTGVELKPVRVSGSWGYTFNASFELQSIVNLGDNENPLAGVMLEMNYSIKTVLKETNTSDLYFLDANGNTQAYN